MSATAMRCCNTQKYYDYDTTILQYLRVAIKTYVSDMKWQLLPRCGSIFRWPTFRYLLLLGLPNSFVDTRRACYCLLLNCAQVNIFRFENYICYCDKCDQLFVHKLYFSTRREPSEY